jgi:anti-sigma B factor antagonist
MGSVTLGLQGEPMLEVTTDEPGGFRLVGELDASNWQELSDVLGAALEAGQKVTIDLSGLTFMDSSGVKMLFQLAGVARSQSRSLVVYSPSSSVARVLEIALPHSVPGLDLRVEPPI